MTAFPFRPVAPLTAAVARRRAHRRLPQHCLRANGQDVIDLSESGLRVMSTRALQGEVSLSVTGPGIEQTLAHPAQVPFDRR